MGTQMEGAKPPKIHPKFTFDSRGLLWSPLGSPRLPKWSPREPKATKMEPKGVKMTPRGLQNNPKFTFLESKSTTPNWRAFRPVFR